MWTPKNRDGFSGHTGNMGKQGAREGPCGTSLEGGRRGNVGVEEEDLQQGWFTERKDTIPQGDVTVMYTHASPIRALNHVQKE